MDEVLDHFPNGQERILHRIPIRFEFAAFEQADFAATRFEQIGLDHALHAGVFGFAERFGVAERTFFEGELLVPGQRPAGVGVEFAFLLGQVLVEGLVEQGQSGADGYGRAVRFQHPAVTGEDGHARPDAGLGQIHRGDVAFLQLSERRREFLPQGLEKVAAS